MAGSTFTGTGKTVVVIDSGWGSAWDKGKMVYQYDFGERDGDARSSNPNAHGARVTATVLKSAPDVNVIELKVTDANGSADTATIERALQWVVKNVDAYDIASVNLSMVSGAASSHTSSALSDEFAALAAKNVVTAVAAGNAGYNAARSVSVYAADPNVVCVSASDGDGGFPSWSQRNSKVTDLCADGVMVPIKNLAGQTLSYGGSSFSAPQVAAAAALVQQASEKLYGKSLTVREFVDLARSTGKVLSSSDGFIELNTDAMLAKLAKGAPQGPQVPAPSQPSTDLTSIVIKAHGSAAGGVNPHFNLLVDGRKIGEGWAGATKDFTFKTKLAADQAHKIQIQYDNDGVANGQDRNLHIDKITINGHAIAPTDSMVRYDKGALDGRDVAAGQSTMAWKGTLVVNAGKGYFPGTTAKVAEADDRQDAGDAGHDAALADWTYAATAAHAASDAARSAGADHAGYATAEYATAHEAAGHDWHDGPAGHGQHLLHGADALAA
ncbi:carbohydrate-binding domain-containing protein [Azospirillum thermophilum]|uniref:Peptidase S8/S53 domain-containing protein n=1 Tax=Azospirillum thermophilum TaxID=2202148 RepID=A0A2S2CWF9_9PROT|nr:hypothetical protein DEW08_22505 [Azospirillum thermophilum]